MIITIPDRWGVRGGTAANLATVNEIPLVREMIIETDTGFFKIGNGTTDYNSLPYAGIYTAGSIPITDTGGYFTGTDVEAALQELGAGGGSGGGAWALVKKTADETRNSTTTLADDSVLTLALSASSLYRVRFFVMVNTANERMDFKWAFNYTGTLGNVYRRLVLQRAGRGAPIGTDNELVGTDSGLIGSNVLSDTTFGVGLIECEYFINTTTAGTLSFQWAQNTSDAGNCTVLAGSYIEWAKFA